MKQRLIIDGNSIYEIDEVCIEEKKKTEEERRKKDGRNQKSDKSKSPSN